MANLRLVKSRLPSSWDGWAVKWDKFEDALDMWICPPPKPEKCECGSTSPKLTARGWRQPKPGETTNSTRSKMGRFGRWVHLPATVPAWPVVDLYVLRCRDCGIDEVWDMRTNEWWELDDSDYGPAGSVRPAEREWTGGRFDMMYDTDSKPE